MHNNKHPYHLVNPSPWPISVSAALLGLTTGGVMYFHSFNNGFSLIIISFIMVALLAGFWWRDLIREGTYLRNHTKEVLAGLRLGFILFIVSEVMFFFSFFWAIIIFFALLLFITVTPNAIHALLALILLFINFAILLFISDASFLGFAYILVYIGAICVLFLYIILLLHMRTYSLLQRSNALILLGLLFGFVTVFSYINYISEDLYATTINYNIYYMTDLQLFSSYLFITHQHYMFLGIFLLLLALLLSIFVSTKFLITIKKNA